MIFYTTEKLVSGKAAIGWHDLALVIIAFASYAYLAYRFSGFKMMEAV